MRGQRSSSWSHNQDFVWVSAFWFKVDHTIIVLIKPWDYRVNTMIKGVLTVFTNGWQHKVGVQTCHSPEIFWKNIDSIWSVLIILKHENKIGCFSVKFYYFSFPCQKIITTKVGSHFTHKCFSSKYICSMQVGKYSYMSIKNQIMYWSEYAKILSFRLRQRGKEVLCCCGYWRHTNIS